MLIVCPKCGVRYVIPDDVTLKQTQKFMCSACAHVFSQEEDEETKVKASFKQLAEKVKLPEETVLPSGVEEETVVSENDSPDFKALEAVSVQDRLEPVSFLPEEFQPVVSHTRSKKFFILLICLGLGAVVLGMCMPSVVASLKEGVNRFVSDMGRLPIWFETGTSEAQNGLASSEAPVENAQEQAQTSVDEMNSISQTQGALISDQEASSQELSGPSVPAQQILDQIKIRGVSNHLEKDVSGQQIMVVEGMIFNMSSQVVALPSVEIRLTDGEGHIRQTYHHDINPSVIAPLHAVSFKAIVPVTEQNIEKAHVVL